MAASARLLVLRIRLEADKPILANGKQASMGDMWFGRAWAWVSAGIRARLATGAVRRGLSPLSSGGSASLSSSESPRGAGQIGSRARRGRTLGIAVLVITMLSLVLAPALSSNQALAGEGCSPVQSSYSGLVSSTPGLVGYWRLGESSGSSVACDFLGHDDGSYLGGFSLGVPGAIFGDSDTAVSLDGSTGQVSVPAAESLMWVMCSRLRRG